MQAPLQDESLLVLAVSCPEPSCEAAELEPCREHGNKMTGYHGLRLAAFIKYSAMQSTEIKELEPSRSMVPANAPIFDLNAKLRELGESMMQTTAFHINACVTHAKMINSPLLKSEMQKVTESLLASCKQLSEIALYLHNSTGEENAINEEETHINKEEC